MATNQFKIAYEIDLDSFQGIGNKFYFKKVGFLVATLTDCIQNSHLNLHMKEHCASPPPNGQS